MDKVTDLHVCQSTCIHVSVCRSVSASSACSVEPEMFILRNFQLRNNHQTTNYKSNQPTTTKIRTPSQLGITTNMKQKQKRQLKTTTTTKNNNNVGTILMQPVKHLIYVHRRTGLSSQNISRRHREVKFP